MSPILVVALIILVTLLVIVLAVVGVTAVGARKVKRHYQGQQELVPGHKSAAPLNWTGSPKREALQHRRLVKAMQLARSVHSPAEADALGRQAILIEQELVRAALMPKGTKKKALDTTESLVSSVEELAAGVYERSSPLPMIETDLRELRQRLRLLEEARRELG
ncbi:MAG: hypothetical protein HKN24_11875 [Acidimicrobiales bacterium]|nr:hypothetical protein [Acidimicrobiales bacterium]